MANVDANICVASVDVSDQDSPDLQQQACADDSEISRGKRRASEADERDDVIFGFEDPSKNLLRNWNFEDPISGNDWIVVNASHTRSQDAHSGEWSLHVHTRNHKYGGAYQQVNEIKPGVAYYYSCFIKFLTHPTGRNFFKTRLFISIKKKRSGIERVAVAQLRFQRAPTEWHQIGGDFITPDEPISWVKAEIEIEDHNVDFLLDSASLIELVPYDDWKESLEKQIQKHRTSTVNVRMNFPETSNPKDFIIKIRQKRLEFGIGSAIVADVFNDDSEFGKNYRQCFFNHFEWASFTNDTKWKGMEPHKGKIRVERVDRAMELLHKNDITVRGHAIHWNKKEACPTWVHGLEGRTLLTELDRRVDYAMKHFKGRFVQWDICNEHLHNHFFEELTGEFKYLHRICRMAHDIDPKCHLYLNDYQLIRTGDYTSAQANLARDLLAESVPIHGIGVQGHLRSLPLPIEILKKRLDIVCAVGLPVMITELSVHTKNDVDRAKSLEEAMYVFFSNQNVHGVLFWNFSDQPGVTLSADMPLFEGRDFKPNKAGQMLKSIISRWRTNRDIHPSVCRSMHSFSAYHGKYEMEVWYQNQRVMGRSFKVLRGKSLDLDVDIEFDGQGTCHEKEARACDEQAM